MNGAADDAMDAIVTALEKLGGDGHGKDGLDGRMFMMARFSRKRFGIFLERALRLRMNAKPGTYDPTAGKKYLTYDEAAAKCRERGVPVEILESFGEELPEEPEEGFRPSGTRDLTEAVINAQGPARPIPPQIALRAAIRYGSDGHGENGLAGYVVLLERTEPKISDRLIGLAQLWQAEVAARPKQRVYPTLEELKATIQALGMDYDEIDKEIEALRSLPKCG
jgi:hypothetical protein